MIWSDLRGERVKVLEEVEYHLKKLYDDAEVDQVSKVIIALGFKIGVSLRQFRRGGLFMTLLVNFDDLINHRKVEWARIEYKAGWSPEKVLQTLPVLEMFLKAFALVGILALGTCSLSGQAAAAEPVFAPDRFTVLNIVPSRVGMERETAADAAAFARATGNRVALYSLTLHPEGRPATRKLETQLASYRAFAAALKGTEVRPGILIQAVIGHWPRTDKDIEPWTRTVNIRGEKVRFCPLDPAFRAYIRAVAEGVAREKPCFILSDDDIRAYSHEAECFCPLHTAEFSKRMGRTYTSDEYRQAVREAKPGGRVLEVFYALQKKMVLDVAAQLRAGIDAVDPGIPSGVCSATTAIRYVGEEAKAMSGSRHEPIFRINNALYMESSPKALTASLKHTMAAVAMYPDIPYILDESDTFPHNLWSKASVGVHAKLVVGILAGLRGSKLWYCGMHKRGWPVHENFTRVFARHRGFYDALVREVADSRPYGLQEPVLKDTSDWHPKARSTSWSRPYERCTWTDGYAGVMGVPFAMQTDLSVSGVWALSGRRQVERLSDPELRRILSRAVLVDAAAAAALDRRGLSGLTGVKTDDKTPLFNGEASADGRQTYAYYHETVPHLLPLAGARVLSHLTYSPFEGAPDERVAPASTLFANALGGRVIVSTFNPRIGDFCRFNEPRKAQFESFLAELNGSPFRAVVANRQDVLAVARAKGDGSLLLAVVNLNFDAIDTIELAVERPPEHVLCLGDDGTWRELPVRPASGLLRIERPLACYDAVVLKL